MTKDCRVGDYFVLFLLVRDQNDNELHIKMIVSPINKRDNRPNYKVQSENYMNNMDSRHSACMQSQSLTALNLYHE
jgi:hypothetical protein